MKVLLAAYLIALHLLCAFLLVRLDIVGQARVLAIRLGVADVFVPNKSVLLLGDSITRGLPQPFPNSVNLGIDGLRTAQLLDALKRLRSVEDAQAVFLLIGINDMLTGRQEGLESRLVAISSAIPPQTPLVWSLIMPTSFAVGRGDIEGANAAIRRLCAVRPRCLVVDTGFMADNAGVVKEYYQDDGVHLSAAGYDAWARRLRTAMDSVGERR